MVEVENGLLGAKRYILMRLIELMIFRKNSLIRNLIGMSGESVCWINHFHFTVARTFVERHIIPSKKEREKGITIKLRKIIFNLDFNIKRSVLINIVVKNTVLQCTIKINKDTGSWFYIGICTPKQVNDVMVNCLGDDNCGSSFGFGLFNSWVNCFGNYSRYFKERWLEKEEEITAVVNNKIVNTKGGKMNIIRNQKRVPHTIVNIPKDGVYLGFSFSRGSNTLSIISFIHVCVLPPPFNDGMRCIAYNFYGGFEDYSYNHRQDEEGKKVPDIWEYYNV